MNLKDGSCIEWMIGRLCKLDKVRRHPREFEIALAKGFALQMRQVSRAGNSPIYVSEISS